MGRKLRLGGPRNKISSFKEQNKEVAPARHIPGLSIPSTSSGQPAARSSSAAAAVKRKQPPKSQQPGPSDTGKTVVSRESVHVESCSLEQRLSTPEPSLTSAFRDLVIAPVMPKKPSQPGRLGRPISLISNLYPLKFDGCIVYHYDIEIYGHINQDNSGSDTGLLKTEKDCKKYRRLNTKVKRIVFNKLRKDFFDGSFAVYDGEKNVYSRNKLPLAKENYKVRIEAENPGDPKDARGPKIDTFYVVMKPVEKKDVKGNIIDLEPLNALFSGKSTSVPLESVMVLETVLAYAPCMRFVAVGRSYFSPPDFHKPLGNGKEAWEGYHQSVRLAQKTPVVNLNISASSFYENIPVIDYIGNLLSKNLRSCQVNISENEKIKINKDLKNIRVETTHQSFRRKYHIEKLSLKGANEEKLESDGKNEAMTVESYFKTKYNRRLEYPHLPCLKVRNKNSFLPMEVCEIVKGQPSSRDLNPKQQAEMIKYTSKPPKQRFREIEDYRRKAKYNEDPCLQAFGLRVLDDPLKAEGRIMETPNVLYQGKRGEVRERPKSGTWNMRDKKFFAGTGIRKWILCSFEDENSCHREKLTQFAAALHKFANNQGVEMAPCSKIEVANCELENVGDYLGEMKKKFLPKMIFIVLPNDEVKIKSEKLSQVLYSEVKRVTETTLGEVGIITQCVKAENVVSMGTNPSFVSNLCLKMNAKMGGVNNSMVPAEVSIQGEEPILFVGADVNHPAPTEFTRYSLAAVVGNLDAHPSRYGVVVRAQKNDKNEKKMVEVILNMEEMMERLLRAYYKKTRQKPKKIIVYRDGVSDGQFFDVQEREIKSIEKACTNIASEYKPGITYLVVQKRHHVRFMPERSIENPPPGTVIDKTVTHPLNFDFFLYSHKGVKGTSRPSYYTVLRDDNKFGFDSLEKMTYALCYTYVRCTKSISLPSPVQYADLAAYRARRHLNSQVLNLENQEELTREKDGKFDLSVAQVQKIIDIADYIKDSMYYV